MSRPTDWHVLDLDHDPTPGEPATVRRMARAWDRIADDAEYAETQIRRLSGDEAVGKWIGEAGDAFREKTGDLPDQLRKCKESYRLASDALTWWAGRLSVHQADADRALAQGRIAREDLEDARRRAAAAAASYDSAAGAGVLTDRSLEPTPEQVRDARQRLASAQAAASSADAAVAAAEQRLNAIRQMALDAEELRKRDAHTAAERIHEASDAGIPERSRWDKFKDWAGEAWDVIVTVAKVVVAVLGVIALIIGGPLAWVVFAAALVLLADAIMKYLNGEGSLWDLAWAALGCIPGTKGLTSLAALRSAFRMGGAMGAISHLGVALQSAGIQLARSANQLRRGLVPGVRAAVVSLGHGPRINSWPAFRTTVRGLAEAFGTAKAGAWDDYLRTVGSTDAARQARFWQGAGSYPGVDRYSNIVLPSGTRVQAGYPGLGHYALPDGTAAAADFNASAVWEGAQVGPGPAGGPYDPYRGGMITLEVAGSDVRAATGIAQANPQYGAGGSTQYFLPDIPTSLANGELRALDGAGNPIELPPGTQPDQVQDAIRQALGGDYPITLTGANSPNPTIPSTVDVEAWGLPGTSDVARLGLRELGIVVTLGRSHE